MIIITLSALGYLTAGCATTGDAGGGGLPWGETFVADSITEDDRERPLVPGTRIELTFEDGRLAAHAGCNQIFGAVSDEGGRLTVDDPEQTLIGCSPELQQQDDLLLNFLRDRPLWSHEEGELWLRTETVSLRLTVIDRQEPALVGTSWTLESLIDNETARSLPAGVTATLTLEPGAVSGTTDCGPFSGEAATGSDTITFTGVDFPESDANDCDEGARAVVDAIRAVLAGEVRFEIDGDALTLSHPAGHSLQFRATE